jgi:hypothetical protein
MTTSAIDHAGLDDAPFSDLFQHAPGCPEAGKPHDTVYVPFHCEDPNGHTDHDRDHGGFGTFACLACRRSLEPLTDTEWDSVGASHPPALDWTQADATTDLDRARLNLLHLRGQGLDLAYSRAAPGDGWLRRRCGSRSSVPVELRWIGAGSGSCRRRHLPRRG